MDPVTAKLIATAAGFGGNILGLFNQNKLNNDQMNFNRSERIAAQEYNTSERLAVQDYNDPKNQMARLMAAGINPNTATGMVDGSTSSPMSISASSMSPVMSQFASNFTDFAQLPQLQAQTKLLDAQAERQQIENKYLDESLSLTNKQLRTAIKNVKADTAYKESQKGLSDSQKKQLDDMLPTLLEKGSKEIEQIESAISLYSQQLETQKKQRDVMQSQIDTNTAQAGLYKEQSGLVSEQKISENWKNASLQAGIDTDASLVSNILNILVTHPDKGPIIIKNFIEAIKNNYGAIKDIIDEVNEHKPTIKKTLDDYKKKMDSLRERYEPASAKKGVKLPIIAGAWNE